MEISNYIKEKHRKDIFRIWLECGWLEDSKQHKKGLDLFVSSSNAKVVEYEGSAECLVVNSPGTMRYGSRDLLLTAVSAVTVSRILRKQGTAARLMASMLAEEIEKGAIVAGLGMFEQGFYNRLGFASMGYEHWYQFNPSHLKIYKRGGIPVRINSDNWMDAYECHRNRMEGHGFINIDPPEIFHAEMLWSKNGFGLGFKKDEKLSHYIWFCTDDTENGPYEVQWMSYGSWEQFMELMGIIKSMEEQVRSINMKEPPFIQLQDFIEKPFLQRALSRKSKFECRMESIAYQQLRICRLKEAIEAVSYEGEPFLFNLNLSDPLSEFIPEYKSRCSGEFNVRIGSESTLSEGNMKSLPSIEGGIGPFTRLWAGVLPASTIGLTEDLKIDKSLKRDLEKAFYTPWVRSDLDY